MSRSRKSKMLRRACRRLFPQTCPAGRMRLGVPLEVSLAGYSPMLAPKQQPRQRLQKKKQPQQQKKLPLRRRKKFGIRQKQCIVTPA
jgi:hypothetical protein